MAADERRRKILEALSVRRYETCDNLAFEFGVSVRTIYNDLLHLSREYPIYTSQGHKGGIRMMDGYYVNRKSLTDKQTELLMRLSAGLLTNLLTSTRLRKMPLMSYVIVVALVMWERLM